MKRLIGALYGIFLERLLIDITGWKRLIEEYYLRYCRNGCVECYRWRCRMRKSGETPYKKFRR